MTGIETTVVRLECGEPDHSTHTRSMTTKLEMDVSSPPYADGPTVPDHPDGGTGEVRPVGRYEWEQIIRRARFTGVIAGSGRSGKDGRATRGGLTAATVKAVALTYASYANDKGREVRPGDATIAVDLECGLKTVRAVKALLIRLGLLQSVRQASRMRAEEYRLTLPVDLLELIEVLTPGQHQLAARDVREAARGKRGTPRPAPAPDPMGWSAGHPQEAGWGGPPDTPNEPEPDGMGWSAGPAHEAMGWSAGPTWGGPPDPRTDHDRTSSTTTDHSGDAVRTAGTVPRARQAAQDRISADVVDGPSPPARSGPPDNRPPCGRPPGRRLHPRPAARHPDPPPAPPDSPGRTAYAAARAALDAQRAESRPHARQRALGPAYDALAAAPAHVPTGGTS